jgi:signal peptidase
MFKVELRKLKTHRIKDAVLAVICLLLVIPILIYGFPFLVGADGSYTVMSGSMSPALRPGDLVIVKGEEPINLGDMVTVESGEFTYTHRVVEKLEGDRLRLKGDANEDPDPNLVEASQIIGKVVLIFPFSHLYTPYGFASALLVPATLIIGKQVYTIHQSTKRRNRRETMRWRRKSHSALGTGTLLLALILTVSTTRIIAPHFIGGSSSYFSDTEWATGFFRAGIWEVGALVDIKPDTLNLDSKGEYVTVYAVVDTEYNEKDIIIGSVMLDGVIQAEWGEVQEDGRLMVKFDRASVIAHLEGYKDGEEATLTVSGKFNDGVRFSGTDTIVVIKGG